MSNQLSARQREPIYCKGNEGIDTVTPRLFVVDPYNRVPTFITAWRELQVTYNYDCENNSTKYSGGIIDISREEFMRNVNFLERKYGVCIFIKTEWGTNTVEPIAKEPEPKFKRLVSFLRKKLKL